jgi:hypothetical protein
MSAKSNSSNNNIEKMLANAFKSPAKKTPHKRQNSSDNLEKMLANAFKSPAKKTPLKRQNSGNNLDKLMAKAFGSGNTPTPMRNSPQINWNAYAKTGFMSPVRPIQPIARKIAPRSKPARKVAPTPMRVASPDRKFAHKFPDSMNTGEKDSQGRIIYAGKAGGKFVISSIGSRVPYIYNKIKDKENKGKLNFTGQLDRESRKIYKGKQGGLFIISQSGKRGNPLRPFKTG